MHMCYERPGVVAPLNGGVGYEKWDRDRGGGSGGGGSGSAWAGRDRERDRERERLARAHQMSHAQPEPDASSLFPAPFRVTGNRDHVSQQIQHKLGDYHLAQSLIDDPSKSIGIYAEPQSPAPCTRRESEFKKPAHAPTNGRIHHRSYLSSKSDVPGSTGPPAHRPPPLKIPNGFQNKTSSDSSQPPIETILKEMKTLPTPLSVIAATPRKELDNKFIFNPYTNKVQENPQLTSNDLKTPLPKPDIDDRISNSRSLPSPDVVNKDLVLSESDDEVGATTTTSLEPLITPIASASPSSGSSSPSDSESESSSAESTPTPQPTAPAPAPPPAQRSSWSLSNFAPPPAQLPEQTYDEKELRHALADVKGKPSPISDMSDSEASSPSPVAVRRRRSTANRVSTASSDEEPPRTHNVQSSPRVQASLPSVQKRGRPPKQRAAEEEHPPKKKRGRPRKSSAPPPAPAPAPPPDSDVEPDPPPHVPAQDNKTHIFRKVFTPKKGDECGGKGGKGGKGKGGKGKGQVTIIEVTAPESGADDDDRRNRESRNEEAMARVSPPHEVEMRRVDRDHRIPDRQERIPMERDRIPADRERLLPTERDRLPTERERLQAERLLTERDRLPIERDRLPTERDRLNTERERIPTERDRLPTERDKLPTERDRLPTDRDRLPVGRDRFPIDRDRLPTDRDRLPTERERIPTERDRIPTERDRIPTERERIPIERERIATERERIPTERERIATERERIPTERERIPTERERIPTERERIATERERIPTERERIPTERERIPTERERIPIERDRIPTERDRIQAERERIQAERERIQAERERIPTDRERIATERIPTERERIPTERTSNDRIPIERPPDRISTERIDRRMPSDRAPTDRIRPGIDRHPDRIEDRKKKMRLSDEVERIDNKMGIEKFEDKVIDRLHADKISERIQTDRYVKAEADVGSGLKLGRGSERLVEASSNVSSRGRVVVRVPLSRLRRELVRALQRPPPAAAKRERAERPPQDQEVVAATNHERTESGQTIRYFSYFERLPSDALCDEDRDHKYYLDEATRLRQAAVTEQEPLARVMLYLESVLCFVLTGRVLELRELDSKGAFTVYRETIEYIKSIHSMPQRYRASPHSTFNKLDILSLRVQALLYLRMFKMYNREVKEYNKIVQEYQQKPACAESAASPLSPTPSPGGSVGSAGSGASSGYCSLAHAVPAHAHHALLQLTKYYTFLYVAHDLWDQADCLCRLRPNQDLFIAVDRKCGPLSLSSTFRHLVQYVRYAISLLKSAHHRE